MVRNPSQAIGSITSRTSRSWYSFVNCSNLPSAPYIKEHLKEKENDQSRSIPPPTIIERMHVTKLLLQDHLWSSLSKNAISASFPLNHSTHGFTDRVKSVHAMERFLGMLVSYGLVGTIQVDNKAEHSALGLVANLLWWFAGPISRLCLFVFLYFSIKLVNNNKSINSNLKFRKFRTNLLTMIREVYALLMEIDWTTRPAIWGGNESYLGMVL